MKRVYSSIPLIIIGVFIMKTRIAIGDGCSGMPNGLQFLASSVIYVLLLLILLIISAIGYFNKKSSFNFYPLIVTVGLFVSLIIAFSLENRGIHTKAGTTYMAPLGSGGSSLTLKAEDKFIIRKREVEWTCVYKGRYTINYDTLTLLRDDIQTLTDSAFSNLYIIDSSKNKFYYVDNARHVIDSARSLEYFSQSLQ